MKRVLIVGASRGIGLEFVRQYRQAGAAVTATARGAEGLARIEALGALALPLDVADAASAAALGSAIAGQAFDVIVHNAGVYGPMGAIEEDRTDPETGTPAPPDTEGGLATAMSVRNAADDVKLLPATLPENDDRGSECHDPQVLDQ